MRHVYALGMSENPAFQLVPDRSCGSCTVCCRDPVIDVPELKKPPGVTCPNCTGKGCKIYDSRPKVCREYHCVWRMALLQLGDEWRPDRSGVVVVLETDDIPPGFEKYGYRFDLTGAPMTDFWPFVLAWEPLVVTIACAINLNIPVFLGVPGPEGHTGRRLFLNYAAAEAAAAKDNKAITDVLIAAYREGVATPSPKITFEPEAAVA
jgi:hypothetical protein